MERMRRVVLRLRTVMLLSSIMNAQVARPHMMIPRIFKLLYNLPQNHTKVQIPDPHVSYNASSVTDKDQTSKPPEDLKNTWKVFSDGGLCASEHLHLRTPSFA